MFISWKKISIRLKWFKLQVLSFRHRIYIRIALRHCWYKLSIWCTHWQMYRFWYPRSRWYLLSLIKMSARNLHDQVDDLKNKLLYGSVAITVYSCPLNFFPKLSFNKAWSLIGDFMWWYVMPFCILFILKNYLVIAMDKTQDLVEP